MRIPYFGFTVVLLVLTVAVNYRLQPNFFQAVVLNGNLRSLLPAMFLAAGQAIVVIGGGVDLSVGVTLSLADVVIVRLMGPHSGGVAITVALLAGTGVAVLAGILNGFCVAYLRFQPIVTTFATSFIISGAALAVLSSPGGAIPYGLVTAYQHDPFGISLTFIVVVVLLVGWRGLCLTPYREYLYAVGGDARSSYTSGVPVTLIRFSTYCLAGLLVGLGAIAMVLTTGTGDPSIGSAMTLPSVVAVVLGGTRLRGGQGGLAGALLAVVILGLVGTIVSLSGVPTFWETFLNGIVIVFALAGPGLWRLIWQSAGRRRRQASWTMGPAENREW